MKGNLTKVSEALQPYREQRAEAYKEKAAALREYARGFAWGRTSRGHRPGQWHEQRADGLRRPVVERCRGCGKQSLPITDCVTKETREVPIGCKQATCRTCERRRARGIQRRIVQSLEFVAAVERDAGRTIPVLLTLTVRHPTEVSEIDPAIDAAVMRRAWILFRARWHWEHRYAFKIFRFEELSSGSKGGGHLHWHIVTFWHHFDWEGTFQRWWSESVWSARLELDLSRVCELGDMGLDGHKASAGNVDVSIYTAAKAAAVSYAAKMGRASANSAAAAGGYSSPAAAAVAYTAKTTDEKESISSKVAPENTAKYLAFVYGKRRFQTSPGLLPKESTCKRFYVSFMYPDDQEPFPDGS